MQNKIHPGAHGVALYILVSIGRLQELVPTLEQFHLGKIALLLAALGFLFNIKNISNKKPIKSKGLLNKTVLIFVGYSLLSITFSIWVSWSIQVFLNTILAQVILFYIVTYTSTSIKTVRYYLSVFVFSAALLCYFMLTQKVVGRLSVSTTYDPNDLAMVMVVILPLAIINALLSRPIWKIYYVFISIAMMISILLTGSRGGFIGFILVLLYFIFVKIDPERRSRIHIAAWKKVLGILIVFFVVFNFIPENTVKRLYSLESIGKDYNVTASTGRIAIWKRGLESMLSRPIGTGIGNFSTAEGERGGRYKASHNFILQVGVELGIVGLFIYFYFIKYSWRGLKAIQKNILEKEKREQTDLNEKFYLYYVYGLKASLIGFFITGMFLSAAYSAILFLLLASINSIYQLYVQKNEKI